MKMNMASDQSMRTTLWIAMSAVSLNGCALLSMNSCATEAVQPKAEKVTDPSGKAAPEPRLKRFLAAYLEQ